MKAPHNEFEQVKSIIAAVEREDIRLHEAVLKELGVVVLWIDSYADLPDLLGEIG